MTQESTKGPLTITGPSPGLDRACDDGGDYAIVDADNHVIGQAHFHVAPGVTMPAKANAILWASAPSLLAALEEITKREGAYSRDPLKHAENTIDSMEDIARKAIKEAQR